ncbi:hypothetical protein [Streptomyces sp. NPDC020571]|uniref:hypothetical protein n=1 Tax=Streptomyces sp. NPDC020571 TaxID=3365079 RepID=UPI003787759D
MQNGDGHRPGTARHRGDERAVVRAVSEPMPASPENVRRSRQHVPRAGQILRVARGRLA